LYTTKVDSLFNQTLKRWNLIIQLYNYNSSPNHFYIEVQFSFGNIPSAWKAWPIKNKFTSNKVKCENMN